MLDTVSHILGIITSLIAIFGAGYAYREYQTQKRQWALKTKRLVKHLKEAPGTYGSDDKGQRTTLHLIRYVGLTEDEILKISFDNDSIQRSVSKGKSGKSEDLLFEYRNNTTSKE